MPREDLELTAFAEDLRQQILLRAEREDEAAFLRDAFTAHVGEVLVEAGEMDEVVSTYHRAHGVEVDGYALDEEEGRLNLLITIHTQNVPPETVTRTEAETAFRRLSAFLTRALDGYHRVLEESGGAFDMALRIHDAGAGGITQVRLILLTDGITSASPPAPSEIRGLPVTYDVWDVVRLHRLLSSGQNREAIEIDFEAEFGSPIPCLIAPASGDGYRAYLALFPAEVLYRLYDHYGARLLELNVRSFLQARVKVNAGIRNTILQQPTRFLAYNNGITATADEVRLGQMPGGGTGICHVRNLQIVNGGQTTASIHRAAKRDGAALADVRVQAKVMEVPPERVNEVVPLISRYSNSQNKVQEADFSANDPFHVAIESFSRTTWAPAADGTARQTRWFYERARGQFQEALGREPTPARKREFRVTHPTAQTFTKTDLAKYENAWAQLPHVVSLGAQKNFREYTLRMQERGAIDVDRAFFERLVARAILFRRAERIVSAQQFGGHRANIVAYTIAYLSHRTAQRLDLSAIWRAQDLPPVVTEAIQVISHPVAAVIKDAPGNGNVGEWAKKKACWDRVRTLKIELPPEFDLALLPSDGQTAPALTTGDELRPEELRAIEQAGLVPAEIWFALSHWAKQTGNLQPWQRSLAFSMGRLSSEGRPFSVKQATQGLRAIQDAYTLGFRGPDGAYV